MARQESKSAPAVTKFRTSGDDDAFARAAVRLEQKRSSTNRLLQQIAAQLKRGMAETAHAALNRYLTTNSADPDAMFLNAEALVRLGRREEAVSSFVGCLKLAPDFTFARFGYARALLRLNRFTAALEQADHLLTDEPGNPLVLQLKANALTALGEEPQALAIWSRLAAEYPARAESWIRYGDALRATARHGEAVVAYRNAIACSSSRGLAWWSLANLKTFRLGQDDTAAMVQELGRPGISDDDRIHLLFALGKAFEDLCAFAQSFEYYAKANAAKRLRPEKYPTVTVVSAVENRRYFTPAFLGRTGGRGCPSPAPIFVLGLQRSGSTLIEQILSAHSAIEGTGELKYIPALARRAGALSERSGSEGYPRNIQTLENEDFTRLGEQYISDSRAHRKLGRAFFTDKNPANYYYTGLIHLILPNAKIIDARRHPAACCFSIFKQNLSTASLRLNELGQNYREYVAIMAHFDRVLPGLIHRVVYEDLVAEPEAEIRKMLAYLDLPFEEACLRFYDSGRAVLTPSSEQVRQPIYAHATDAWRNFEPWLKSLLDSLGSAASAYPSVPEELL